MDQLLIYGVNPFSMSFFIVFFYFIDPYGRLKTSPLGSSVDTRWICSVNIADQKILWFQEESKPKTKILFFQCFQYEEKEAFTPSMAISNLGGQAGLWLGCSAITIIHALVYAVRALASRCWEAKTQEISNDRREISVISANSTPDIHPKQDIRALGLRIKPNELGKWKKVRTEYTAFILRKMCPEMYRIS